MSDNLSHFLVDLASDADRRAAFMANPLRELEQSDLTAAERAAVMTRDGAQLRSALGLTPWEAAVSVARKAPPKQAPATKPPAKKGGKKKSGKKKK